MDATILAALDELQSQYIVAMDAQDMQAWKACFSAAPETSYIWVSAENDKRGLGIALMYDDCRARIEDRVSIVTKVWAGTYQAYRTRHFVQRVRCRERRAARGSDLQLPDHDDARRRHADAADLGRLPRRDRVAGRAGGAARPPCGVRRGRAAALRGVSVLKLQERPGVDRGGRRRARVGIGASIAVAVAAVAVA